MAKIFEIGHEMANLATLQWVASLGRILVVR